MTFFNNDLFTRHIKETFSKGLNRSYAVLSACPFDRLFIARRITSIFKKQDPEIQVIRHYEPEGQTDLFETHRLFLIDSPQKDQFFTDEKVIYTGEKLPFTEQQKKEIVTLDLTGEKPWEAEVRRRAQLQSLAKTLQKTLDDKLLALLIKLPDFGAMQNELLKLTTYVGNRVEITLDDAKALSIKPQDQVVSWKAIEAMLAGKQEIPLKDPTDFYPLLGQLRYLLQKANQTKALAELFRIECMGRTRGYDLTYLWTFLTHKIRMLHGTHLTS